MSAKKKNSKMIMRFVFLFLAIVWMGVIFLFSAQDSHKSSELSGHVTQTTQKTFFPKWSEYPKEKYTAEMSTLEYFIRKAAHFSEYLLLGFLIAGFLSTFSISYIWVFLIAISASFLYAASDEWHQSFVEGRAMLLFDMLIDTIGSAFGSVIMIALHASIRLKKLSGSGK